MAYHLYDSDRRHFAMSDSLADLESAAWDMFSGEGRSFGYIRWTDPSGEQKEICISPESLAAKARQRAADPHPAADNRQAAAHRTGQQRARRVTNVILALLLTYLAGTVASMAIKTPISELLNRLWPN